MLLLLLLILQDWEQLHRILQKLQIKNGVEGLRGEDLPLHSLALSFLLLIASRQRQDKERDAVCKCCVHRLSGISQFYI